MNSPPKDCLLTDIAAAWQDFDLGDSHGPIFASGRASCSACMKEWFQDFEDVRYLLECPFCHLTTGQLRAIRKMVEAKTE